MPERVFLGWDAQGWGAGRSSCLDAAADWLLQRAGAERDLSSFVVAVPGARAGRRLLEVLVERAGTAIAPPQITTAGQLTDRFLTAARPLASGLVRSLAWQAALAALDDARLAALVRPRPATTDWATWRALADDVRARHAELGREGRSFAEAVPLVPEGAERARWQALVAVHEDYRRRLLALGLDDPHDARREALHSSPSSLIASPPTDSPPTALAADEFTGTLVLVGVTELSGLLRGALQRRACIALIFAPPQEAARFDDFGAVQPEAWAGGVLPLERARWFVEERPADQATRVVSVLAEWGERFAIEDVTLGVPGLGGSGDEIVPHLRQLLGALDVELRPAVGPPLRQTGPFRLLAGLARLLREDSFDELAALARHPELEAWLAKRPGLEHLDLPALLDDYHARHLPGRRPRRWLEVDERSAEQAARLRAVEAALRELLGPLQGAERRTLARWAEALEALLARLDSGQAFALIKLRECLAEFARVPAALAETLSLSAAEALETLLEEAAALELAPPARRDALELLGWLELPLDDARALVVVNLAEGQVPEPVSGLSDGLRRRLGLPDDALRLARDAHALTVLLNSKEDVVLVTGRRSQAGDPLRPSRLLFHVPEEAVAARVRAWVDPPAAATRPAVERAPSARPLLVPAEAEAPQRVAVTKFRDWLASPYLFYLNAVLGLRSVDDEARECEAPLFGVLLHSVLAELSTPAGLGLSEAADLGDFLVERLEAQTRARFGQDALPVVALQLDLARGRLRQFAFEEARRRAEGWQQVLSEQRAECPLRIPGEADITLVGVIDRVDVRGSEWAILDYKSGEEAKSPREAHGPNKQGRWRDLQLPLYRHLLAGWAAERGLASAPQLGYANLGRDADAVGFAIAEWSPDQLQAADEVAREAVRAMRRPGAFAELGRFPVRELILAALAGLGVFGQEPDEGGATAEELAADDEADDEESEEA
ncbi:MAG: PD-(D/E)XK nuclease family protein [Planctomycetota bacterium]